MFGRIPTFCSERLFPVRCPYLFYRRRYYDYILPDSTPGYTPFYRYTVVACFRAVVLPFVLPIALFYILRSVLQFLADTVGHFSTPLHYISHFILPLDTTAFCSRLFLLFLPPPVRSIHSGDLTLFLPPFHGVLLIPFTVLLFYDFYVSFYTVLPLRLERLLPLFVVVAISISRCCCSFYHHRYTTAYATYTCSLFRPYHADCISPRCIRCCDSCYHTCI